MTYTIWPCDCRTAMSLMDADSVDSVVCDPPYGLSREPDMAEVMRHWLAGDDYTHGGNGFMNAAWDSFVPGPSVWREAYRVLKPGGHLVAFFGTRTYDLGVLALRLAGFEVRDQLAWVFGCLDEETEAVTIDGVKPYHKIIAGDLVLCYDASTGGYSYQPVQEVVVYDYEDTAYRLVGDFGEQVVSRNHRVIVERDGRESFVYAESLQQQERIPVLESLPDLQQALRDDQSIAAPSERVLRDAVPETDSSGVAPNVRTENGAVDVRDVRRGFLQTDRLASAVKPALLQHDLQRDGARDRVGETRSQGPGSVDRNIPSVLLGENERTAKSRMERRRDLSEPQGQLCEPTDQIRPLPGVFSADGAQGWVCDGASSESSRSDGPGAPADRGCSPYQPSGDGQRSEQSDAVCNQSGSQEIRGWSGHKTALVRVVPFQKRGKVWCLRVPTGAFVAVRGGVAFPTGNSGFPKSHDVSKGIDRAMGVERVKVLVPSKPGNSVRRGDGEQGETYGDSHGGFTDVSEPSTPEAAQWQGWGTALKPAYEPIVLCRKPLSEPTVAANVLRWGTGAVNVDGCRVGDERRTGHEVITLDKGRWPANLCHDGSPEVLAQFPDSKAGVQTRPKGSGGIWSDVSNDPCGPQYGVSGSAARFFYCAKASKADRNRGLEDHPEQPSAASEFRPNHTAKAEAGESGNPYGRWSPVRNTHPTVKPTALMQWLVRLVTPLGGTVLDPFMGSGSTGVAAVLEGFDFIGCEMTDEYVPIATARIDNAVNARYTPEP